MHARVDFFETLVHDSVARIDTIYSAAVFFKDPFTEVGGRAEIAGIFRHMFAQVNAPRFVVTTQLLQEDQAFLTWDFHCRRKRFPTAEQCIRGATPVRFDAAG